MCYLALEHYNMLIVQVSLWCKRLIKTLLPPFEVESLFGNNRSKRLGWLATC